ncbi:hypothetical protein P153DRAFT_360015 [Dothidotthia symphoricarpi CBS 119687]|uniref:Uncharacterized protein n=1 Tax=Dothidotthia symphoricarpi CBS 119687 TaxID=1392245 RepID=A0A6A6A4Z6_9PLEO|nr:uncharacterized protein P153DRAFT_360015 [Dothidotthia symphoricarpi CBS 119687]KAF2125671.1 hypothetical protein P153DRAFT_360015 [Dothidotthia symphoricarpi CBS 119687]
MHAKCWAAADCACDRFSSGEPISRNGKWMQYMSDRCHSGVKLAVLVRDTQTASGLHATQSWADFQKKRIRGSERNSAQSSTPASRSANALATYGSCAVYGRLAFVFTSDDAGLLSRREGKGRLGAGQACHVEMGDIQNLSISTDDSSSTQLVQVSAPAKAVGLGPTSAAVSLISLSRRQPRTLWHVSTGPLFWNEIYEAWRALSTEHLITTLSKHSIHSSRSLYPPAEVDRNATLLNHPNNTPLPPLRNTFTGHFAKLASRSSIIVNAIFGHLPIPRSSVTLYPHSS